MDTKEFAALKPGDKVKNLAFGLGSVGEVVSIHDDGVRVVWGPRSDAERSYFYAYVSTAWKHWNKVDDDATGLAAAAG